MRDIPIKTPESLDDFINLADRFKGHPDNLFLVLTALTARGMSLDAPLDGQTVMCRALSTQRTWLVESLLQAGADPMAPGRDGAPVFRMAVSWNETQAVLAMLHTGRVDVGHVDESGGTALHDASLNGNEPLLQALLDAGANGFTKNQVGEGALDVFERTHASHALPHHKHAAEKSLQKMDSQARTNLMEEELPFVPSLAPARPKGRM